jgi:hypothetical protein
MTQADWLQLGIAFVLMIGWSKRGGPVHNDSGRSSRTHRDT